MGRVRTSAKARSTVIPRSRLWMMSRSRWPLSDWSSIAIGYLALCPIGGALVTARLPSPVTRRWPRHRPAPPSRS
ncbi:hypothetical protein ACFFX0_10525 [Citricoccus parietis]|uniref:Uncharacterized protein n=1 Tax=Citricoccus parietis TaxID=592307 RepID=A0ABV5FY45_9MICC